MQLGAVVSVEVAERGTCDHATVLLHQLALADHAADEQAVSLPLLSELTHGVRVAVGDDRGLDGHGCLWLLARLGEPVCRRAGALSGRCKIEISTGPRDFPLYSELDRRNGRGEIVDLEVWDYNGAAEYFSEDGSERWAEIEWVLHSMRPQLQASDQAGKVGVPIFDPKGTNAQLTARAHEVGWDKVVVPADLRSFGKDWDAGKGSVLAEWQFSNYPFLWNNIIRSEAVFQSGLHLPPLTSTVDALIIVAKSGSFPASNSTLYAEQAVAQIDTVTTLGVFEIPIRLVGLMLPEGVDAFDGDWNEYDARYGRDGTHTPVEFSIAWGRPGQYGNRAARLNRI